LKSLPLGLNIFGIIRPRGKRSRITIWLAGTIAVSSTLAFCVHLIGHFCGFWL
jgi:hypothetical protein